MSGAGAGLDPDLLVVYGTLRSGTGWRERLGVAERVAPLGPCVLDGSIYALGWYPGLVLGGGGEVQAEVLRLLATDALAAFDRFEGYDPAQPDAGEYRRLLVGTPFGEAWVYELRAVPAGAERVDDGDWLARLRRRGELTS